MLTVGRQSRARKQAALQLLCLLLAASAAEAQSLGAAETGQGAGDLAQTELRLAKRYDQLEVLAGRLAELSQTTQPRRAQLLRELIKRSRQRDLPGQFDAIAANLDGQRYSTAIEQQQQLQKDLQTLLELLLQEDRDRQIESQRRRIGKYLQEVKRLIRLQRGVRARTEGADDAKRLVQDQQRVGEQTGELHETIKDTELDDDARDAEVKNSPDDSAAQQEASPSGGDPEGDEEQSSGGPEQTGESGGAPTQGQPGQPGQPGGNNQLGGQPQRDQPINRAAERIQQAQQRMKDAREKLEQALRDGALQQQQQALNELEEARAELERVLRQLREEERERMLASLESRFRRMLNAQIKVYEETLRLSELPDSTPLHELEIAAGRLSRNERQIVAEADRALLLLREDGTSVAFPEAVEQARSDMETIAERLLQTKLGLITQGLEEDVILVLEEALAVLQKSLEDARQQQGRPGRQNAGDPGEDELVDSLEELGMIRSMQVRVNKRTEDYGRLIEGEQAVDAQLLEALNALSDRQQRIWRATRDLGTGENR